MGLHDLREYIEKSEEMGALKRVDGADWNLEIAALSLLYNRRKSVLFDQVKGCPPGYRIMTNVIATDGQDKLAMGIPPEMTTLEAIRHLKTKLTQFKPIPPEVMPTGPVLENVVTGKEVDLLKFPSPFWHELDGGRYMGTMDMVVMRDPENNWVNIGTYRVMVHDAATAAIYISPGKHGNIIRQKYWAENRACPVAIVCGQDPAFFIASSIRLPYGMPEYDYVGWLKEEPAQVVEAPVTHLPVPAYAELVIEGEIPPPSVESRKEGPFGEWTGYYASGARDEAVVRVKSILHRNDPIMTGLSPGRIPGEARDGIPLSAILWNQLEQAGVPGIKGVWFLETGIHLTIAVSIQQLYNGHARQAGAAVAGCGQGAYLNRFVIVVDDDVDPTNEDDVWWAVASRCDPATSIDLMHECWGTPLDPRLDPEKRERGQYTNSKAILYACKPFHWMKRFPPVVRTNQELIKTVMNKYKAQLTDISTIDITRLTHG